MIYAVENRCESKLRHGFVQAGVWRLRGFGSMNQKDAEATDAELIFSALDVLICCFGVGHSGGFRASGLFKRATSVLFRYFGSVRPLA